MAVSRIQGPVRARAVVNDGMLVRTASPVYENGEWVRSQPGERRASHIAGTDLTRPVSRRMLQPGEVIIMCQRAGGQPGTYLARTGVASGVGGKGGDQPSIMLPDWEKSTRPL